VVISIGVFCVEGSGGVVVFAAVRVGENVVGIIYYLELSGTFGAFGVVGRNAVGVRLEGCSVEGC
jgi:hypothetical protein